MAKQRRIFVALIENSSDFIGIVDPQGKPIYMVQRYQINAPAPAVGTQIAVRTAVTVPGAPVMRRPNPLMASTA
jgi:hypothetical protein